MIRMGLLQRRDLKPIAKLIYGRIWGFKERGCFQSNETIALELGVSESTVTRHVGELKNKGLILVWNDYSSSRHMWAKDHPKVKASGPYLPYNGGTVSKRAMLAKKSRGQIDVVKQDHSANPAKSPGQSGEVTKPNWLHRKESRGPYQCPPSEEFERSRQAARAAFAKK